MASFALLACTLASLVVKAAAQPTDGLYTASVATWTGAGYKWGSNSTNMKSITAGVHPATGAPLAANGPWRAGDTFVNYGVGFTSGVASGDPMPGRAMIWTRYQPAGDQSSWAAADPENVLYTYNNAPAAGYLPIAVNFWVGLSATGSSPLVSGVYTTDGSRDWTVKLDVNYTVQAAGTLVYYGFNVVVPAVGVTSAMTHSSPVGSFRAINPTMTVLSYAVVSCSNWGFGYFNGYDTLAKIDGLDFYSNVGDNIYEYADLYYPDETQKIRTQVTDPPTEIVTLDDYRRRYRLYRLDQSMQLLGSKVPLIMLPDDHEYTNNPWMTGAQNHQPTGGQGAGLDKTAYPEGDFYVRMENALQAMYEYNPTREPGGVVYTGTAQVGSTAADLTAVTAAAATAYPNPITSATSTGYIVNGIQAIPGAPVSNITALDRSRLAGLTRSFDFGTLMTYALTEGRVAYRTSSAAVNNNGSSVPLGPTACPSGTFNGTTADAQCSPVARAAIIAGIATLNAAGTSITWTQPATWTQAQITALNTAFTGMAASSTYYNNPAEHVIGSSGVNFLSTKFTASKAANISFQAWASQTVFQITESIDILNATAVGGAGRLSSQAAGGGILGGVFCANSPNICSGALAGLPWNVDSYDGYYYERQAIMTALMTGNNPIVNSGDAHGFWLGTIKGNVTTGAPAVSEFAGGGVSSPGWGDSFSAYAALGAPTPGYTLSTPTNQFLNMMEDGFVIANRPNGMVASRQKHGVLVFKVTPTTYTGQVFTVDTLVSPSYKIMCDYAYQIAAAVPGVMNNLNTSAGPGCVSTVGGVVPGTWVWTNGTYGTNGGLATGALPAPVATVTSADVSLTSSVNINGLHVSRWFSGGGGQCNAGMGVADCTYRRRLFTWMRDSLLICTNPLRTNRWSISHRGAPTVYPEHTTQGYAQALADGAGWIECDVAVTKDMQPVCRHSQCDLSSTTNILAIPALSAKCTVPGKTCCTYDLLLSEYNTLCGKSGGAPALQVYSWSASNPSVCPAKPATLAGMAAQVYSSGKQAGLIPEQKNCDLMCQAKLAAANNIAGCTTGTVCPAVIDAISDAIVNTVVTATAAVTSYTPPTPIVQSFEKSVTTYLNAKPGIQVAFLFEVHGQNLLTTQSDYYLGSYPAAYTTIGGVNSTAMGSPNCSWCVNGTSAGGWADVLSLGLAGVEYCAASLSDMIRPQGALMVASAEVLNIANKTNMQMVAWTLERSTSIFSPTNNIYDTTGWAYQQHGGVSSLDYEDQLFMLYALRYTMPDSVGVFSDFPGTATAFANCVPQMDVTFPVSLGVGWTTPNAAAPIGVLSNTLPVNSIAATPVVLSPIHIWRMFAGGGGLCAAAGQDATFYDYDIPTGPALADWGGLALNKTGLPTVSTSAADCAYRTKLMTFMKNNLATSGAQLVDYPLAPNTFSVAHRGTPMTHPEHSDQGYQASIAMGADWIECDVAPTLDMQMTCRHSACDLHTTTNVLLIPSLAPLCSIPFKPATYNGTTLLTSASAACCTYDFSLAQYNQLCAIQDIGGSGWTGALTPMDYLTFGNTAEVNVDLGAPFFRSGYFNTLQNTTNQTACLADPATLAGMAAYTVAAGRNLVPEQKTCDMLCQAKLAAYAPNGFTTCTQGTYCVAVVNAISDAMISILNTAISPNVNSQAACNTPGKSCWAIQSFEMAVAMYVNTKPNAMAALLYQYVGANLAVGGADPYYGNYAAGITNISGVPNIAMGRTCTWCSNGTLANGWADVFAASAAGVEVGGISIADVVVPQGALMVASKMARLAAAKGLQLMPWTVERSSASFGAPTSTTFPQISAGNLQQYPTTTGGYYGGGHAGVSSLDYEDQLFMLYALKYDVPNVIGVFSDYPATATAFANSVPMMDTSMPVAWNNPMGSLGVDPNSVQCNTWLANGFNGLPGYYAFLSGNNTCLGLTSASNLAPCCSGLSALFSVYNTGSPLSHCTCESDFAGMFFGAFGVGNGPIGTGPIGLPMSTILNTCNAMGFTGLMWPGATNSSFDCNTYSATKMILTPNVPASVRAPYLMAVNSTSATIKWRSATKAASVVCLGTSVNSLVQTVSADAGGVIEHTVVVSGLTPNTVYMYAAGVANNCTGGSNNQRFKTTPAPGGVAGSANVRFWAHGDFGTITGGVPSSVVLDGGKQTNVYDAWLAYEASTGRTADAWLALGDNAYNTGSDPLYQYNLFNVYSGLMSRTPIYPVIGNHDAYSWLYTPVAQSGYQTAFGVPLANSASLLNGPGVVSGTMRYYSFNIGRVHVVSLDSMTTRSSNSKLWSATEGLSTYASPVVTMPALANVAGFSAAFTAAGSPNQMEWLAADLAAVAAAGNTDWILCQYHHPSHSDGSHKSDTEIEMVEMRVLYNPILEAGGVDICFHGHSHGYERTLPIAGFFGLQSAYASTMASSGYTAGTYANNASVSAATFVKPVGLTANGGTTYVVAGAGGQFTANSATNYQYVASATKSIAQQAGGSLVIDVKGQTLTMRYIYGGGFTVAGTVADQFVIYKGGIPSPPPPGPQLATLYATLGGYTVATFTPAHQVAFVAGVATLLTVPTSSVTITNIANVGATSGRHLLQGGIVVTYTVLSTSSAATLSASLATGLQAALATAFTSAGLVPPTSTSVVAVAPTPVAVASSSEKNNDDLGALVLLILIPVGAFVAYKFYFQKKAVDTTALARKSLQPEDVPAAAAATVAAAPSQA